MYCKVKTKTYFTLFGNDGNQYELFGNEVDAYLFKNDQIIILHPHGTLWLDKSNVEFIEKEEESSSGSPNSSLRSLLGQNVKTLNVEFK